jgi:hypothetical protein
MNAAAIFAGLCIMLGFCFTVLFVVILVLLKQNNDYTKMWISKDWKSYVYYKQTEANAKIAAQVVATEAKLAEKAAENIPSAEELGGDRVKD